LVTVATVCWDPSAVNGPEAEVNADQVLEPAKALKGVKARRMAARNQTIPPLHRLAP
jgi:hypothetical protein